jgi:alpha-1,2-mannosyltransferase
MATGTVREGFGGWADPLRRFLLALAVTWHVFAVGVGGWSQTLEADRARDFASYFYAVQVAADGGDPYDTAALSEAARDDGTRKGVHPFLYAPPFLLGMSWALTSDLGGAYRLWFWMDEMFAIAAMLVLWRWWRPVSRDLGVVLALLFAAMTAVPNNHVMGQANFPGLLLSLLGLWAVDRDRPGLGGFLVGTAAMLKMSPALFLVLFALRGQWRAVAAAIGAAVWWSVAALPLAGPAVQLRFYTQVLPSFSTGYYNGLAVPIDLFGNHSWPDVLNSAMPGRGHTLSTPARFWTLVGTVLPISASVLLFPRSALPEASDPLVRAAQVAYFGVLLLLIPVYTYEHHLVFALPAALVAVEAARAGRLSRPLLGVAAFAVAVLLVDLQLLKGIWEGLPAAFRGPGVLIRESKFLSLVGLLLLCGAVGRVRPDEEAA